MSDETVVEMPFGAIGVTRRYVWPNKGDLTLTVPIEANMSRECIDETMDRISHIADREEIKVKLAEKALALEVARAQPAEMDREIERLQIQRATALASMHAMHSEIGKRGVFRPNTKQAADLEKYDLTIENARRSKKSFLADVPIIEWEIACLTARRDSKPLPEKPPELLEAIAETLGMAAE